MIKKILFILIIFFVNCGYFPIQKKEIFHQTPIVEKTKKETKLTIQNVKKELIKQKIQHPDIVLKQVKVETGHLKHVKHNNLFGFRNKNGYMKFKTWKESIEYKKKWQKKNYKGGNYYNFLEQIHYAEDSNYVAYLKKM